MATPTIIDQQGIESLSRTLSLVGVQYRQQMDALAENLTAISKTTRQLAMQTSASFQHFVGASARMDWPKVWKRMEKGSERLGNLGWTLPITFTLQQVAELSQCPSTDQGLEQYMFDYFTGENGRGYLCLRSHVSQAGDLLDWRALLEQCFDAYDRGRCLIPIPSLLSVIEGAVAKNAGRLKMTDTDPKRHAADLKKRAQRGGMDSLIWHSTKIVLERLFKNCRFDKSHPRQINRSWVLHGRDQTQWTQIDALRLFNLLGTIS